VGSGVRRNLRNSMLFWTQLSEHREATSSINRTTCRIATPFHTDARPDLTVTTSGSLCPVFFPGGGGYRPLTPPYTSLLLLRPTVEYTDVQGSGEGGCFLEEALPDPTPSLPPALLFRRAVA